MLKKQPATIDHEENVSRAIICLYLYLCIHFYISKWRIEEPRVASSQKMQSSSGLNKKTSKIQTVRMT